MIGKYKKEIQELNLLYNTKELDCNISVKYENSNIIAFVFDYEKKDIDKLIEIIRCYIYGLEKKKKKDLELKIKELEEKIGINNDKGYTNNR